MLLSEQQIFARGRSMALLSYCLYTALQVLVAGAERNGGVRLHCLRASRSSEIEMLHIPTNVPLVTTTLPQLSLSNQPFTL